MITITPPMTVTTHHSHPCSMILTTPINTNRIVKSLSPFTFNESNNHVTLLANLNRNRLQQSVKFAGGNDAVGGGGGGGANVSDKSQTAAVVRCRYENATE